jgi:hypothetical protein
VRVDTRAHPRQRFGDATHGPARQRCVAHQRRVEGLARQQAGKQAHAGAGVAAVQRPVGAAQAVQSHAVNDALARRGCLDRHAQLREHRGGGAGVLAFQETADARAAIGQRGQHQRAVRDGLVARHRERAAQRSGRAADPVQAPGRVGVPAHGKATG